MSGDNHAELIWMIADLLCSPYRPKEYGHVLPPFTVQKGTDCVRTLTRAAPYEVLHGDAGALASAGTASVGGHS